MVKKGVVPWVRAPTVRSIGKRFVGVLPWKFGELAFGRALCLHTTPVRLKECVYCLRYTLDRRGDRGSPDVTLPSRSDLLEGSGNPTGPTQMFEFKPSGVGGDWACRKPMVAPVGRTAFGRPKS